MVGELKLRFKCSITSFYFSFFVSHWPKFRSNGNNKIPETIKEEEDKKILANPMFDKVDHDVQIITIYEELFLMEENKWSN
jgi:hypothetical protein